MGNGQCTRAWQMIGATLLAGVIAGAATPAWAQTDTANEGGRMLMADALVNDARARAANDKVPAQVASKEAYVLLQKAHDLDPNSPTVLQLLSTAAVSVGDWDMAKTATKQLVGADPGNLVAQVSYLDFVARPKPVEEQIRIYQSALNRKELNAQVRSEMAVRVGTLLLQRGEADEAMANFTTALQLNDVNVGAWQQICKQLITKNAKPQERLSAIVNLLLANPYQPDALIAGARILEAANLPDPATDFLIAAVEQVKANGVQVPGDLMLEMAVQMAAANRKNEADAVVGELAKLENAPIDVALLAYSLKAPHMAVPGATDDGLLESARKRLAADVEADAKSATPNPASLENAIWVELFYAGKPADSTDAWIEKLKGSLGQGNDAYLRLVGWKLLRDGKFDEAKRILEPLAAKDSFAQFGMVRVYEATKKDQLAKDTLQDLWNSFPSGMLGFHVAAEARKLELPLKDTALTADLKAIANRYPTLWETAHRQPRDLVLLTPTLAKTRYNFGEPIMLNVTMTNTTDRPLSVGPMGAVSTSMAIEGTVRGIDRIDMGVFAIENSPRMYRLEHRAATQVPIRLDQRTLRDMLYGDPTRLFDFGLALVTAPRGSNRGAVAGLGGQHVAAGQFERNGFAMSNAHELASMIKDFSHMPVERQMLGAAVLQAMVYNIPEDRGPNGAPAPTTGPSASTSAPAPAAPVASGNADISLAQIRKDAIELLTTQLKQGNPLVQAWMIRYAPPKENLPADLVAGIENLKASPDPLVRLAWYSHFEMQGLSDRAKAAGIPDALRAMVEKESDPLVRQWAFLLSQEATTLVALQPTTTTAPAPKAP